MFRGDPEEIEETPVCIDDSFVLCNYDLYLDALDKNPIGNIEYDPADLFSLVLRFDGKFKNIGLVEIL